MKSKINGVNMYQLINDLSEWNIELSDKQIEQFKLFESLLLEWNEKINLTAITEHDEILKKHFLDSLSFCLCDDKRDYSDKTLLDLGTGAGFPGIPLKIVFPELKITLVDSLRKRVDFLNLVITELGLSDIEAVHSRAEDLAKDSNFREQYDFVVSRAVANLSVLSEYCIPFVKVGGQFISYKAGDSVEEIDNSRNAIGVLGCSKPKIISFSLPDSDLQRCNVISSKIKMTENRFPRKAGIPTKKPL